MSSRQERTLAAVFEEPTRANILWRDVISMLAHFGATMEEREGSRVVVQMSGIAIVLHRPHPHKEIASYVVRDLRKYLTKMGVTP
jgi:hypothetical protein